MSRVAQMYAYYDFYKRAEKEGDSAAQTRWANQLAWEIARHAVGEEIVVYPLMEKHLGSEGLALADHDREEHQVSCASSHLYNRETSHHGHTTQNVKQSLYELEGMDPGSTEYSLKLEKMMVALHKHNDDEEIDDLPKLEAMIGQEGSVDAAGAFKKTKKFVPTRSVS